MVTVNVGVEERRLFRQSTMLIMADKRVCLLVLYLATIAEKGLARKIIHGRAEGVSMDGDIYGSWPPLIQKHTEMDMLWNTYWLPKKY